MRTPFVFLVLGTLAALAVSACGNPATASAPAVTSQPSPGVTMTDANVFQPATLSISTGTTVTWTNTSAVQHTVTADASKAINAADVSLPAGVAAWDSGPLNPAQTYSHTFTTPGTYKYVCIPHESIGMVATIVVS